jgi:hypothetical protein
MIEFFSSLIAKKVGVDEAIAQKIIEEFNLELHRNIYEYKGMNGDYIGGELHYQIGIHAYYHFLGFLDVFSERYGWGPGDSSEYLSRIFGNEALEPYLRRNPREDWIDGRD